MKGLGNYVLEQLSELARQNSSDKRLELMGKIADLFVANSENYDDRELFLFGEILSELINNVDLEDRVQLSNRVAPINALPRDLAMVLANQEVEVAAPVLERSMVLTDEDLVEIVRTKSTGHRIAISNRNTLTNTVTDALLSEREQPVLQSVCSNKGAEISDDGFGILADSASGDDTLCELLSQRTDIPMEILSRVIPLMSADAQARLVEITEVHDDSALAALLEKARRLSAKKNEASQREIVHAHSLLEKIQVGELNLALVIESLCKENKPIDIGYILSGTINIPQKQIVNALMKADGKAIIVLCRALNFSEKTFSSITTFRAKRLNLSASTRDRENREFSELDGAVAKRTLRFIQVRNVASAA